MAPNNIAFLRRRRNFSQTRLSEMTDIPVYTLSRIESGETESFEKHRLKIAAALGCAPEDLDADELKMPTVPVTGIVKYKSFVKATRQDEYPPVESFPGLPPTAQAIMIKGTHLMHYHGNGDLLYVDGKPEANEQLFLGRECMVELDTKKRGEKLIAWVSKSSKNGHFTLHPHNSPMMIDVKIRAAHPVLHVKRV